MNLRLHHLILLSYFHTGFSALYYPHTTLARHKRQSDCGFKCDNGQCIEEERRCNGNLDCTDGSDENESCKSVSCPGFLFTCKYGACIDSEKECDLKNDCVDGSDENTPNCRKPLSSNCQRNQFTCSDGQCIGSEQKCDGKYNCNDKSDESEDTCAGLVCPGFAFRCKYGGCVNGDAKCNNEFDCVDGSDEINCNTTSAPVGPTPPQPGINDCILPKYPENGKWSLLGPIQKHPGEIVTSGTSIIYSCNDKFASDEITHISYCNLGSWSLNDYTCSQTCPAIFINSNKISFKCYSAKNHTIPCDKAITGAKAVFRCADFYEEENSRGRNREKERFCYEGAWDLSAPNCVPACGQKRVDTTELILEGKVVEKGDYPWVTAVYNVKKNPPILICGGSLISLKVVLTAAHCVCDRNRGTPYPAENYEVAVGKYYRDYADPKDKNHQFLKVVQIEINFYKGANQQHANDLAVLIIEKPIELSFFVQPVCLDIEQNIHLSLSQEGLVTGWGYTVQGSSPSNELKELNVPIVDDTTCERGLPPSYAEKFLTKDKFCAGYLNRGIAVCEGDSGGGLVINVNKRYFIQGIVSLSPRANNSCNHNQYALYTKISEHITFLRRTLTKYRA